MDCGEFLDFRAAGFDRGMAHHTLLRVGQPGLLFLTGVRMAIQARHAFYQMPLVAKADRLRCYPDGQLLFLTFISGWCLAKTEIACQRAQRDS